MTTDQPDWTKPAAMAIPPEGYFELKEGRYGPTYPRTPACHGFSIIAKVKEGREEAVRAYGKQIEEAVAASPEVLAPLRLHYLRWQLFDVGSGLHFQYQGIFDTDFDKYTEDAVAIFAANHPAYLETLFAIWHAGAVAVPISSRLQTREAADIVARGHAKLCFASEDLAAALSAEVEVPVAVFGSDEDGALLGFEPLAPRPRGPGDDAWIFYTSGTTGKPKGARLSHANLWAMAVSQTLFHVTGRLPWLLDQNVGGVVTHITIAGTSSGLSHECGQVLGKNRQSPGVRSWRSSSTNTRNDPDMT